MIIVGLLMLLLLGFSIVNKIGPTLSFGERIGLGFLTGTATMSLLMFLMDITGVPITTPALLVVMLAGILGLNLHMFKDSKGFVDTLGLPEKWVDLKRPNLVWIIFGVMTLYMVWGITQKSLFWPSFSHDTVAGYDFQAKVIAEEGKINNSIYPLSTRHRGLAIRSNYPPLMPTAFAFNYLMGEEIPKAIIPAMFIFFLIAFYSTARNVMTGTAAMITTSFVALTPEMLAHVALSLINLPHAMYASLGVILMFLWIDTRKRHYFWLAIIFMSFNAWVRNEGVLFAAAGGAVVLWDSIKTKAWKDLAFYSVGSLAMFAAWQIYMRVNDIHFTSDIISAGLVTDGEKWSEVWNRIQDITFETTFYGIVVYVFMVALVATIPNLLRGERVALAFMIVGTWALYVFLFYQIDYSWDSIKNVINYSYKREFFCFVPIMWFYVSSNRLVAGLFERFDRFLGLDR